MPEFERNDLSLIDDVIDKRVKTTKIGKVSRVYEHSALEDDSNFELDIEIDGGTTEERRCPFVSSGSGQISVPRVGDKVLVIYTEGDTGKPLVSDILWSNKDRPPLGLAGMYRDEFESDNSPIGGGNLNITGYTEYDERVADNEKYDLTPERALIQIAKHERGSNIQPTNQTDLPAKVELYDSPADDEAHIKVEINKVDGADSDAGWGMEFNIKTGEWKLVGPTGFGIESDGNGNFQWHYKSITYDEVDGDTGPLDL